MVAAASFNGGRSQTGLSDVQFGGEYAFLNVVKTCQGWSVSGGSFNNATVDPSILDVNGYPTSGGYYSVCFVPSNWIGQSLTVQWDGGGEIKVPGSSPVGTVTSSNGSTNNSITCTCTNQQISVGAVSTNAAPNHIKNIRVSLTGAETTALNNGDVFRDEFKNKLLEAGFGVLRFMDWQVNNTTNMTDWGSRKPVSYYSYSAYEFRNVASTGRPKLYCGDTTNSGNAYSITGNGDGVPSSGAPANMQVIQLRFNADATESGGATLNLNGTGAKTILDWYGQALLTGYNNYPIANYAANPFNPKYGTAVFDAGLDAWLLFGGQTQWQSMGIQSGVPPEICLQLAAEIGAHPYFCMPRYSLEYPSDYVPSLAAYCIANAPSWMIPRFETPNEIFNTGNAYFHNGVYGQNKANVRWGSADKTKAHGYWASIMGQAVAAAYGVSQSNVKTQTRYHSIVGVQTGGAPAAYSENLSSAAYVGQAAAPPAGYSKTVGVAEAWRWATHICVAQYFNPADQNSPEETAAVAAYQTADAKTKAALLYNYVMSCVRTNPGGDSLFQVAYVAALYAGWKTWAQSFSVNKMCGYEGGFSPDYGGNATVNSFRNDCKAVPELADIVAAVFQSFIGQSDNTFTAEFPSTFQVTDFTGTGSATSSIWTLLKGEINSANTPQFDFITRFNKGRRAISLRLRIHG